MHIIFNKDGSIKEQQLNDYINKGSDGVNFIDVVVYDDENQRYLSPDEYVASGSFILPDGTTSLTATPTHNNSITTSLGVFEGYRFTLYEAFTQEAGTLKFSLVATSDKGVAVSFAIDLTVNQSALYKNTTITWEEYEALKRTIGDYQLQYSASNVRAYYDMTAEPIDYDKLASAQYFLMNTVDEDSDEVELHMKGLGISNPISIGRVANRKYYVYTQANYAPSGVVQTIGTGLAVNYVDTDGNKVNFGTNPSEFYAYVLGSNDNYIGTISLGAKIYEFNNAQGVKWLEMDDNASYLRSYNGSTEISLGSGEITAKGNNIHIKTPTNGDYKDTYFNGENAYFNHIIYGNAGANFHSGVKFYGTVVFDGDQFVCYANDNPTDGRTLTNKNYVDKVANSEATAVKNFLQMQIDAINESQNFVATYGTYADMPEPQSLVGKFYYNDCVLVLKDETHNDQAYVYKWTSSAWTPVGELGDYYTKAQIDGMHTDMETKCQAHITALFAETSSETTVSE